MQSRSGDWRQVARVLEHDGYIPAGMRGADPELTKIQKPVQRMSGRYAGPGRSTFPQTDAGLLQDSSI
jgi:hypothetical protein